MTPDRYTSRAREALAAAMQLALARRHPEITPSHLVHSLLAES